MQKDIPIFLRLPPLQSFIIAAVSFHSEAEACLTGALGNVSPGFFATFTITSLLSAAPLGRHVNTFPSCTVEVQAQQNEDEAQHIVFYSLHLPLICG